MATIDSLHTSITARPRSEVYDLLMNIRAVRRTKPAPKKRAPVKTKRRPNAKAPRQQDLFALAEGMTTAQKTALAVQLLEAMK